MADLRLPIALAIVAGACAVPTGAAGDRCRDVTADVGIDVPNPYGPVVASEPVGRIMQRNMGNGAAVGDYDGDGDLDVYLLTQAGSSARLFRNDLTETGEAGFSDVTGTAGVADEGLGRVAHFLDLDGDGDLDLLVVNDTEPGTDALGPSRLFRNDGDGTFSDVTEGSGFDPEGYLVGGAAPADFDGDGDLDLYVTYWTRERNRSPVGAPIRGVWPGSNRYYENLGDLRFRDATEEVGLDGMRMDSFTALPHDFDRDGDLDLYVAVDHRADRYYENVADGFRDGSADARVGHRGNDMGIATADVDGDGSIDLFVSNVYDPQQSYGVDPPGNTLLLTQTTDGKAVFTDVAREVGVLDTAWSWGAAFVDIDLDTDADLFVVQGFDEFIADHFELDDATASLLLDDGTGSFSASGDTSCEVGGDQRALVPFDHDRDGDPDLLVTQVDLPPILLDNRAEGTALTVALDPTDAASYGAVVEASVSGVTMRRLVIGGGSYLAGMPMEAYFGLGGARSADVTVTWADGDRRTFRDVAAGTLLRAQRSDR